MSVKIRKTECGCEVIFESIPRSMFIRERWGIMCPVHDAEHTTFREESKRAHDAQIKERKLREELT